MVILRSLEWALLQILSVEAWVVVWEGVLVVQEVQEAIRARRSHQPLDQVLPLIIPGERKFEYIFITCYYRYHRGLPATDILRA